MQYVIYPLARLLIALLQALPLSVVAGLGRLGGGLAFGLDARHRRVALKNLTMCFGAEKTVAEIRALALENFRRIGESFACGVKTASMGEAQIRRVLELAGSEKLVDREKSNSRNRVIAIGHFGNFEVYMSASHFVPGFRFATTYRALRQPLLDGLVKRLREQSGGLAFERRTDASALREAMNREPLMIGFLADQHAGDKGRRLPFFGHDCSTSAAPALFALRYDCPLHTAICYRVGVGRWRIEVGDAIPTHERGRPRTVEAISIDINQAFETAIRRDPANWFWVHNRWKPAKPNARKPRPRAQSGLPQPSSTAVESPDTSREGDEAEVEAGG